MKANPREKMANVAKIVSDRLGKDLNKMRISRINNEEKNILGASEYSTNRVQLKSPNIVKFDELLFKNLLVLVRA